MSVRQPDATADPVRTQVPTPATYSTTFRVLSDQLLADKRLNPADKIVLMALQKWGFGFDHCFPSLVTLAAACGISQSTARRSLVALEKAGLIRVEDDPGNRTTRRIVRLWTADPELHPVRLSAPRPGSDLGSQNDTPPLGVKMEGHLGSQNDTPPLGVKMTTERTSSRELQERTTKTGSSSLTTVAQEKPGDADVEAEHDPDVEPGDGGWSRHQMNTAIGLAVKLWPGESPDTMRLKVEALCEKSDLRNVVAALRVVENSGKPKTWGFVVGTAGNLKAEGGVVTTSSKVDKVKAKPGPVRPETLPIRTGATPSEGKESKWSGYLARQSPDLREAIEKAGADVRRGMMEKVEKAPSPVLLEHEFRTTLGLPTEGTVDLRALFRPVPPPARPEPPTPAEIAAWGDTSWMQPA